MRWTFGFFSLTMLLACDANLGTLAAAPDTGSESDDSTTGDDPSTGGDPLPCIGGELCPAGTGCANGLCATDCSSDTDCATDEYCGLDDLCHANVVPSCNSDQDCAVTQTCKNQVCTTLGDEGCDLENYLQDGCASNAVCLENFEGDEQGTCYEMPACAADQSCPIGLEGAVCNTEYLPTKDEICLVGLCDTVTNCPEFWSCVRYDNAVLGYCSSGGFASPCTIDAHCLSGNCVPLPGFGGGICG
jgi:hypothetical protein